ncbi:MAG: hypothetical protein IPL95_06530 [Saprospiraceae bacterium]|nr:hypothetical protein [Saprospiraceae bacterium]
MAIDSLGYRWYGTSLGASRFDGVHYDNFTNIANDIPEISSNSIRNIICYKEDIIFLNSDGLLFTYNLAKSLTKLDVFKITDKSNNLIRISNICKSTIENIVFGFDNKNNIYKINIKKLTYELANWSIDKDNLFNKVQCSINIGNSIWIGAANGLFEFDLVKNKIQNIPFAHLIPDTSKYYAVGSIDRFDENSIVFGSSKASLSSFKGMILYNKKFKKIERLDIIGFNNVPLSSLYCKVSSIKDSLLCIIPGGKGPIIYNFKTNTYDTIPVTKNKNQLNTISIGPCHMDDKGKFTICTNQGLFIHEPFSSAFEGERFNIDYWVIFVSV